MTGKKLGKLTVVKWLGRINRLTMWECLCDCGNAISVYAGHLRSGHTTSCGCVRAALHSQRLLIRPIHTTKYSPVESSARAVWRDTYGKELPYEDFFRLSQMNCHYCNAPPSNQTDLSKYVKVSLGRIAESKFVYSGLDRIDSTKNHTVENTVSSCKWCNYAKRERTVEEFKSWIERAYLHFVK